MAVALAVALSCCAGVELKIEDLNTLVGKVPLVGNFKPFGGCGAHETRDETPQHEAGTGTEGIARQSQSRPRHL